MGGEGFFAYVLNFVKTRNAFRIILLLAGLLLFLLKVRLCVRFSSSFFFYLPCTANFAKMPFGPGVCALNKKNNRFWHLGSLNLLPKMAAALRTRSADDGGADMAAMLEGTVVPLHR